MRIPVIVLSGFLGSGKTTLLLRLLKEAGQRGLKPGVLMNELGRQDVDGLVIHGFQDTPVEKLLDGCVCCSKKSELGGSLRLLLQRQPDVIFIELTGVANPEEIADALTEPELLRYMALKQVITLLDAEHVLDYNSLFASDRQLVRTVRRQMEVADLIIVNKTDLVSAAQLAKIEKAVRKQNERAPVAYAVQSEVDLAPVMEQLRPIASKPAPSRSFKVLRTASAAPEHSHAKEEAASAADALSYSRVQTVTLPWPEASGLTQEQVERFLRRWKDRLLRAKGYLRFEPSASAFLLQFAGKRVYWEPAAYDGTPYVVVIGLDLDERLLREEWQRLG